MRRRGRGDGHPRPPLLLILVTVAACTSAPEATPPVSPTGATEPGASPTADLPLSDAELVERLDVAMGRMLAADRPRETFEDDAVCGAAGIDWSEASAIALAHPDVRARGVEAGDAGVEQRSDGAVVQCALGFVEIVTEEVDPDGNTYTAVSKRDAVVVALVRVGPDGPDVPDGTAMPLATQESMVAREVVDVDGWRVVVGAAVPDVPLGEVARAVLRGLPQAGSDG